MKILKAGRLYRFPLDCPDIERFFFRRLFRKLGIPYVPFTLQFYDKLYLREDKSKFNRVLVHAARRCGIQTYVVQEGAQEHNQRPDGHVPLFADYFLCPEGMKTFWVQSGMPPSQIREFIPDKTRGFHGIVFMAPLFTRDDIIHPGRMNGSNTTVMAVIQTYLREDVVFKLHAKNKGILAQFIPKHRIVDGPAEKLIHDFDKIYCFRKSTIRTDCEMQGREYEIVM